MFAPVNPTTTNGIYNAGFGKDVITDFTANMTNASHDILSVASMFAAGTTVTALVNGRPTTPRMGWLLWCNKAAMC